MPSEIETIAHVMRGAEGVPWHGLGNPVDLGMSSEEMRKAAGCDWTISKRPMFTPNTVEKFDTLEEYMKLGNTFLSVNDYFALVRDTDKKRLGICGKDYIPTQNKKVFEFFERYTRSGKMQMETAGSLQGGKMIWALAGIRKSFKLFGEDEIGGYLLFCNPHVWGKSLTIKFTSIRVVCWNTLAIAMSEAGQKFRMPHIYEFDGEMMAEAEQALGIASELLDKFEKEARILSRGKVNAGVVANYVADAFQPELVEELFGKSFYKDTPANTAKALVDPKGPRVDPLRFKRITNDVFELIKTSPGAGMRSAAGTLWGAFNAVTYYIDHRAGRDRDNALYAAWFGQKAVVKSRALARGLEFARSL